MNREAFLSTMAAALASTATATPSPTPAPLSNFPKEWSACEGNPGLPYGRPLALTMRVLDGPNFDLLKYRGRALLVNIFATWCGPCNKEMPYVVEAASDYESRGLSIVGIDVREPDNTVRAFRRRYDIPFPIAMDRDGTFAQVMEFGKGGSGIVYPVSLFIDPNGFLNCDTVGGMGRAELRYRIEKFLAVSAPAIATPSPAASPSTGPR